MTMRKLMMVLAAGALVGTPALAQHDATKPQPPSKPGEKAGQPTKPTNPSEDPMMQAMIIAGTPGEAQKTIEKQFAGEWDAACKFRKDATAPWEESKGSLSGKMIFDGRYLVQHFKGDFGGMPFEGHGTLGYNNTTKKYESVWVDSMSTATMFMTGSYDAAKKAYTLTGEGPDCMDPTKTKTMKFVLTVNSNDKHTEEFYSTGPDGKEFKGMEITYTRRATTTDATEKHN